MGNLASINFKPVKSNSERHNERIGELHYVFKNRTKDNESWKADPNESINQRYEKIARLTKKLTGRSIQAKATPIREAVLNLRHDHTMDDLHRLRGALKKEYGIDAFQIHIHRDEGYGPKEGKPFYGPVKLNLHAHMVFDWQDKKTGKSFKLYKQDMSKIQDLVSETLNMERGELKENSNVVRLEAVEFKAEQERKRVAELQEQAKVLEQKKNEAERRNREAKREYERAGEEHREVEGYDRKVGQELSAAMEQESRARERYEGLEEQIRKIRERNKGREEENERYREVATILKERPDAMADFSEEEINGAIQYLEKEIRGVEEENSKLEEEYSNAQDDWRRKRNSD